MREKTPDELRKQDEAVQLDSILSGEHTVKSPEEFVASLRKLRRSTGLDPKHIEAQHEDLLQAKEYQIAQGLESAVIKGEIAGEGKHGIVLRISKEDIPETAIELLDGEGVKLSDPSASKVIKIYQHGVGREEFEAQSRAYEALSEVENPDDYLRVPRPFGFRDTPVTQNTIESLRRRSKRFVALVDRAEFIFMEFIEGQELLERLYDFVLTNENYPEQLLWGLPFEGKEELVTTKLVKFFNPGGKSSVQGERNYEKTRVENDNADRLAKYLVQYKDMPDFPLSAEFLEKLDRTVKYLHDNGIYHGDLHERNIMVDKDGIGFIIDFGRSGATDERTDDNMIVRRYRSQFEKK
ncbi:MAG: hypothetical protein A3B31_02485 [Candidatus Komeilibacteria bacterium RIFCSPLOWO2_01_FULL_53_11]|uniref:Protein kinase domain-containing protein n=1 Tax=Candidatus Komeilibacteria bacterium RIFCSPLOWO2_01_FULL_53_11 TaxID=1798552 RepID=A0A1G2BSZ9_9BACT|nr:MAG: hypothetical protein A3B31_02485 [Candidatus Komeilibacteria bacterium RIFCSPLOWO2_01_FULL_53_11]